MANFNEVSAFHGHACPGLALGYRVAVFALERLGGRSRDEELVAVVENNSCAVDAVQVVAGCTFGKGNLIFHDYGKQVYTFFARPSGRSLRIAVNWTPPAESDAERAAWEAYAKGIRSPEIEATVHARKSRKIESIIEAPDDTLFSVTESVMAEAATPRTARIYPSVRCEACGEKVMEPRARLLDGKILCIPCFNTKE